MKVLNEKVLKKLKNSRKNVSLNSCPDLINDNCTETDAYVKPTCLNEASAGFIFHK